MVQIVDILPEICRKNLTIFLTKGNEPFLAGMGLFIQSPDDIEVRFHESGGPVADAYLILPFYGLENLTVIGGKIAVKKPQILMDDVFFQPGRVGDIKTFFGFSKTAIPIVNDFAGQQVMPHAGGVTVVSLETLYHIGNTGGEIIQIPEQQVEVNAVVQSAVVFQLPEVVAVFHVGSIFTQDFPTDFFRNGSGAVKIDVIV